ncbi:MAG: NADPH:quinone oxidoreductase family protein [Candidatus Neomarinimicrobiota bacterium]|tara:strand:- start:143 stop:1144 length:1002 start_codon:yes stop_codon:yes gene_type:complete
MKAILCKEFGPVSDLVWEETADPVAGKGEVVVDIKAAGLNYPDNLIVQGLYQFQPKRPFSPGHEGAGIVSSLGEGVNRFKVGDSVAFFKGFGAFAEKIVIPAEMVFSIPEGFPHHIAAGVFMVYGTSYHALVQRADIRKGDEVLVLGASGGVGLAAVDIAKSFGARVVAAVSTKEKAEVCAGYGVDDVVIYGEEKLNKEEQKAFTKELKSKSINGGYSIIYDPVGDCFAEPALRSIGWGGTYLVVGFAAGKIPSFPTNLMLLKGCAVSGVFIGRFQKEEPKRNSQNLLEIGGLLAEGKLAPMISETIPMKDSVGAIERIARRGVVGKVVFINN